MNLTQDIWKKDSDDQIDPQSWTGPTSNPFVGASEDRANLYTSFVMVPSEVAPAMIGGERSAPWWSRGTDRSHPNMISVSQQVR